MEKISDRLTDIIEHYGLTASSFADKTGVQRSGVSHLLSGRNKPSLDFIVKLLDAFPELNLYWLLNGNGSMLTTETASHQPNPLSPTDQPKAEQKAAIAIDELQPRLSDIHVSASEKIIILHKDGTFTEYLPRN